MPALIVFSHLRWNFVHQRPQHLLTRLSGNRLVLFIEEPIPGEAPATFEEEQVAGQVRVLRPRTPVNAAGFHDAQVAHLQPLLEAYLRSYGIDDYLVWFYTPMALPLLAELAPQAVIYDCMDELSSFKDAPRQMAQRDTALLKRANLVLTGGPSLFEHKRRSNPNVHCLPSAVDRAHFAKAGPRVRAVGTHPTLGFFGVIDERLDIPLIAALADAHPDWRIDMVGPVVKIDAASLPVRDNLHWLGQQGYHALPALIGGWDVCLIPFAINAATRFISPTKTLEYMAADRPVVSTPIHDVVTLYGDSVRVAYNVTDFIAACEAALDESAEEAALRREAARVHLDRCSWDSTARRIEEEIERLSEARDRNPDAGVARYLIAGTGPTGLSAALQLGRDAVVLERADRVGGWCRSIEDGGFTFDCAGHIMFSNDPFVLGLYEQLLGTNVHWQNREAWIYSKNVYTRYPFQGSLYGLPPAVLSDCLVGAIEAHIDSVRADVESTSKDRPGTPSLPGNFEEFIHRVWGSGIAEHFALPYNRKLWAVPLTEMETSWLGGRVPLPDLRQMVEGALQPSPPPMGPNARFGYPLRGGFQALMDGFLPMLKADLHLNAEIVSVSPSRREVHLADGRSFRYETLISTMPLPALVRACGDEAPREVRAAAAALRHVSVRCVNFGVGREAWTNKHWIYYPEDTVFHRIFLQGNASPYNNPPGGFGLTCEITYNESKPLPCEGAELVELAWQDCIRVGMVDEGDARWVANQVDMPCAYVVYDHARTTNVACIRSWLDGQGVILAGRYSEWEYYNSDHAFLAGRKAAQAARAMGAVEVPGRKAPDSEVLRSAPRVSTMPTTQPARSRGV